MIFHLSPDSALRRKVDPEGVDWGMEQELLATLVEVVDYGNRVLLMANSKKGTKAPEAIKINRPWQKKKKVEPERDEPRKQSTPDEVKRFFNRAVKYKGEVAEQ